MSETQSDSGLNAQSVLVLYGDPPNMTFTDASGRIVSTGFALTSQNQSSFEKALMRALASYFGAQVRMAKARFVRIRNATDFFSAVKEHDPAHLIYYGHALTESNTLLPMIGRSITAWQISNALKAKSVRHFDILGCTTVSLAAELSIALPKIRIGHLRAPRMDN